MADGLVTRSTPTASFSFDGLMVRATFAVGAHIKLVHAREHFAIMRELTGGRRVPVLVDASQVASQDREARALYAGSEAVSFTSACAIVVGSPVSRIVGSFFLGFNKPLYPTRLFSSREEAERWLGSVSA